MLLGSIVEASFQVPATHTPRPPPQLSVSFQGQNVGEMETGEMFKYIQLYSKDGVTRAALQTGKL